MDTRYVERTPPTGSFPMRFSPAVGAPKATPRRAKPGSWGTPGETWGPTTTLEASSMLSHLLDAQPTLFWADFRGKLLGPTDPASAPEGSLRQQIYSKWSDLGRLARWTGGDGVFRVAKR